MRKLYVLLIAMLLVVLALPVLADRYIGTMGDGDCTWTFWARTDGSHYHIKSAGCY